MKRTELVKLIQEIVNEALEQHLDDYVHTEKPLEECEKENES